MDLFSSLIQEKLNNVLNGDKLCVLAHGESNSGKTYTLEGDNNEKGIIKNIIKWFLDKEFMDIEISVACVQIYNNYVKDVLDQNNKRYFEFKFRKINTETEVFFDQCCQIKIHDMISCDNFTRIVKQNKLTRETKININSSRSHVLTILRTKHRGKDGFIKIFDLAGNENISRAKTKNQGLTESININKSLVVLKRILISKTNVVPFGDSNLTKLFKDVYLSYDKIILIATINLLAENLNGSLKTLEYVSSAKYCIRLPKNTYKNCKSPETYFNVEKNNFCLLSGFEEQEMEKYYNNEEKRQFIGLKIKHDFFTINCNVREFNKQKIEGKNRCGFFLIWLFLLILCFVILIVCIKIYNHKSMSSYEIFLKSFNF